MIYLFFPIFAATIYALTYIYSEKVLEVSNAASLLVVQIVVGTLAWFGIIAGLVFYNKQSLNFTALQEPKLLIFAVLSGILGSLGFVFTLFAVQKVSASYTAFAEISYPLFTILFLFLFFGLRHFDWSLLFGGVLIMLGSFILIYGQTRAMT